MVKPFICLHCDNHVAIETVTRERDEARRMQRWNVERTPNGDVLVCQGDHDKCEPCSQDRWVPEACATTAEAERDAARAEVERLRDALCEAVEWNGCDDEGVPAVWLKEAEAVLATLAAKEEPQP